MSVTRTGSRRRRVVFRVLAALALAAAIDAAFIEPRALVVTRHAVHGRVQRPLLVAHLSDLHTRGIGVRERRLLALLAEEKPDVIVITGDTITTGPGGGYPAIVPLLRELRAPLGVFLVRGNWENWSQKLGEHGFYAAAGVRFLLNESAEIVPGVWLVGLDDPYSGIPHVERALRGVPAGAYTVALMHAPVGLDEDIGGRVDLALAGHTHGGQIALPVLDRIWLPTGCGRFIAGWYERRGTRMYVSRGIGTSGVPLRFYARPELAMIRIQP